MRNKPSDTHVPPLSTLSWWYWMGNGLILILLGLGAFMAWTSGSLATAGWAAKLLFASSALMAVLWVIGGVALHRATKVSAGLARQLAARGERVDGDGHSVLRGNQQDTTELDAAEVRLQQVQEIAAIGEWIWNVGDGRMTWSGQVYRMYGLDPATFTVDPESAFGCIHPDDRDMVREYGQQLAKQGEPCRAEFRIVRPDGVVRVIDARWSREPGNGERVLIRSIQQDITELVNIRDRLYAAQDDYRFLFEGNPLPLMVYDRESLALLAMNEAAVQHYGYSRAELPGMSVLDMRPPSEVEHARQSLLDAGQPYQQGQTWTHRRKDGTDMRVCVYGHELKFEGHPARLVVLYDVTDREAAEQRFQLVARATSDVVWDWDVRTGGLWWGESYYSTFGYERSEVPPTLQGWEDHLHPDDRARVIASLEAAIADPASSEWEAQYRYLHGDGCALEIIDRGFILRDADGRATRAVGGMLDITQKRRAESEMRLLQRTVESAVNGICIVDMRSHDSPIVYVNPAFEQMTGYAAEEVIGRNCRFLQGPARDEAAIDRIHEALRTQQPVQVILKNQRKDGTPFWNELLLSPVRDDGGVLTHYVGIQDDVSERFRLESKLAYAASHDPLTGLVNRTELREHLERLIADPGVAQHSGALLFIDLDNFKLINDSLGHETGDLVLQEVARRLGAATRSSDLVARFGGDEFVALLQSRGANQLDMPAVVERIQSEFLPPIRLDGTDHYVTASIGYVRLPDVEISADGLLMHADLAMYKAKQLGRNRALEYSPGFGDGISGRLNLIAQIGEGLRLGQFVLHYQPIMHADGEPIGVEALVRWQHPERGLLAPGAFIDECESSGLIVPLGRWVMLEAGRCARALLDAGITKRTLRMSVNVSALQFQLSLLEDVTDVTRRFDLPEGVLELELTESSLMSNADEAIAVMTGLRAMGLQVAIDDFGTGYSSLAYLKRLPINRLKIDRSFVNDLPDDPEDAAICRSVIGLAHSLGLLTVAEGVETVAHRDFLVAEGCDELQGYLFARPMPMEDLLVWLRDRQAVPIDA
jgi:diguanylate cyclase (GGDEF)-like protein/PAS domain S-box-containing protein